MSTHLLKSPDTVSATAVPQAITLPETNAWYSIRNSGAGAVYYIAIDISNYTAATYTSVTAAALRTAGCGMVASGESTAFITDFPSIYIVCANGVTATVNIEPGIIASVTNIEANLGNVGLLNAAETEINPATSDLQTTGNAILTTMDADTGNIATSTASVDTKTGTVGGAADVDGAATVQLRYIGEAVSTEGAGLTRTPVNFTAAAAGTTAIVAVGTYSLYVVGLVLMTNTEVGITITTDTASANTALTGILPVAQRGGLVLPPWPGLTGGWLKSTSAKNLGVTVSAACDIDGWIITRDAV